MIQVVLLVEDQYEEMELWYPCYRLKEEKIDTLVAGPEKGKEYRGKNGYPARSEAGFDVLREGNFQGIIVPGGYAPDRLRRYPEVLQFVREMDDAGKLVASICHGPWVLISAGVMNGRRSTCFFAIKDDLVNAGGLYSDEEVVTDGNLITSRIPSDLPAFCREIVAFLRERFFQPPTH